VVHIDTTGLHVVNNSKYSEMNELIIELIRVLFKNVTVFKIVACHKIG